MQITLRIGEADHEGRVGYDNERACVEVETACPSCASLPLRVRGMGIEEQTNESETAAGQCVECGAIVGRLTVTYATIFGREEDGAVLAGRARVY